VLPPCGPCLGQHPRLQRLDDGGNFIFEQHLVKTLDVGRVAIAHDVGWHLGLELALAPEHHHRVQLFVLDVQEL